MTRATFAPNPWLRRYRSRPFARAHLVCLPHAGGTAGVFSPWAEAAPEHVEVLAVQYPGRQDRHTEPLISDIHQLTAGLAEAVRREVRHPILLFGHSMGAAVAFELALRLEQLDRPVHALFVSGRPSPSLDATLQVHDGGDDAIWEDLRRLGGVDPILFTQPELLSMLIPILRSDYRLSETYEPRPLAQVKSPIHALVGERDPDVSLDQARGWSAHTNGEFQLKVFPGAHFYFVEQLKDVTTYVCDCIAPPRAETRGVSPG